MKSIFTRTMGLLALTAASLAPLASCVGDLDQTPSYSANADVIYRDPAQALQVLARLYATFAISGQNGPSGSPDIANIDEGFSNYMRQYWQQQEITTDEAILGWNDGNLIFVNTLQYNADNEFTRAIYDRINYEIGLCNEFVRQTTDAKLSERGVSETNAATMRVYRAEARLLRALCYWHSIDMFGGGPFADENSVLGDNPPYRTRKEKYDYVEKELLALETEGKLLEPRAVYGRADKAMLWTLLTKLYLNAKVYTGTDQSAKAIPFTDKVLAAGYTLAPDYYKLFLADNDKNGANSEVIFPITFDGLRTKSFGGMTYLIHASTGRAISPASVGINGGWAGLRAKETLTNIALAGDTSLDRRQRMFFFRSQNRQVDTIGVFSSGPLVRKYRNVTTAGVAGSDTAGDFPDTDFPMFRLADVMLMKAEALLRTNGDKAEALRLVNLVRQRATGTNSTANNLAAFNGDGLQDILDERARELFWEGHRRTDLIRFGKFATGYNWPFKGGPRNGTDVSIDRALFPIPTTDIVANPNLVGRQNPGY